MAEVTSSGQKRITTNDGRISINQGENAIKVETKTKAVLPPSQGGSPGDIQKAIDAIRLVGGVVTVRNGTYLESADITQPSNVALQGESFGGVVIVFQGAYSIKAIGTGEYSTGTIAISPGSDTVTGTDTLWLANLTTSHKIRINGIPFAIESVDSDTSLTLADTYLGAPISGGSYIASILVEKPKLDNLIVSSPITAVNYQYTDLATITNVVCPSPGVNGFYIKGSSRLTTSLISSESAVDAGIYAESTYFINMERAISANSGGHGFQFVDCSGVVLTSCPSNGNTGDGVNVESSDTIALIISQANGNANGLVFNNSSSCVINAGDYSGNTGDGVKYSDSSGLNINSSVIANGNGGYGINIVDPSCANNRITGCQLLGNSSGDINDSGTGTVIIQDGNPDLTDYFNKLTDDSDDITEGASNLFLTSSERTKLSNTSGTNTGDQIFPVKATGAEVDTGTDDAKFLTPKAIADSTYAKEAYADGKVSDTAYGAGWDGDTTVAPSKNAVYDKIETMGGGGTVDSVVAGNNIDVDATDPANPIVAVEALTPADIGLAASVTELDYTDGVTSPIQTQLNAKAADADVVHDTGNETIAGTKTFSSDPIIPDEAYDATNWNGSLEPPTKNAIRDKIESMSAGILPWTEVTGTSQSASVNNGYIASNVALVTVTLPTTAPVGSVVRISGKGAGGFKVAQNASELIHFGSVDTTTGTGGSLASTNRYDAVELVCVVADTEWLVLSSVGNITVT